MRIIPRSLDIFVPDNLLDKVERHPCSKKSAITVGRKAEMDSVFSRMKEIYS